MLSTVSVMLFVWLLMRQRCMIPSISAWEAMHTLPDVGTDIQSISPKINSLVCIVPRSIQALPPGRGAGTIVAPGGFEFVPYACHFVA